MNPKLLAPLVMVGVLAVVGLLLAPPSSGSGGVPIVPNPYAPTVQQAISAAGNQSTGTVETVLFSQQIHTSATTVSCAVGPGSCHQLHSAWGNVSNPFVAGTMPPGAKPIFHQTWVNVTANCGAVTCPPNFLGCDATFFAYQSSPSTVVPGNRPCYSTAIIWSPMGPGQIPLVGSLPSYNVTRLFTFSYPTNDSWIVAGKSALLTINELSLSPTAYGTMATTLLSWWNVPSVTLAVPYPTWTWALQLTTFVWANATAATKNFSTALPNAFVAEWQDFPITYCPSCGVGSTPAGRPTVEQYVLTLVSSVGTPVINGQGNQTGGIPPTVLILTLGNVTGTSNGGSEAQVTWLNPYALPFNGTVILQASFLYTANISSVSVQSLQLAPDQFLIQNGTVTIFSGSANVSAGKVLQIAVYYVAEPTTTATSTLAVLNGLDINLSGILVAVGVVSIVIYAYIAWRSHKPIQPKAIIAVIMTTAGIWVVVVL